MMSKRRTLSLGAVGVGLALALVGAFAVMTSQTRATTPRQGPFTPEEIGLPPEIVTEFMDAQGQFTAPLWDSRQLSDAQKAADPVFSPGWKPFSACMANAKFELRANPARPYVQADLDQLLARLNRENPEPHANLRLSARGAAQRPPGLASSYLGCAEQWLRKTPKQIYEITGEPNFWYPGEKSIVPKPTP